MTGTPRLLVATKGMCTQSDAEGRRIDLFFRDDCGVLVEVSSNRLRSSTAMLN